MKHRMNNGSSRSITSPMSRVKQGIRTPVTSPLNDINYSFPASVSHAGRNSNNSPASLLSSSSPSYRRKRSHESMISINGQVRNTIIPSPKKKKVRSCGNCGQPGHTRSSITCPQYNSVLERQRRAGKRLQKEQKLKDEERQLRQQMLAEQQTVQIVAQLAMQCQQISQNKAQSRERFHKQLVANQKKIAKLQSEQNRDF